MPRKWYATSAAQGDGIIQPKRRSALSLKTRPASLSSAPDLLHAIAHLTRSAGGSADSDRSIASLITDRGWLGQRGLTCGCTGRGRDCRAAAARTNPNRLFAIPHRTVPAACSAAESEPTLPNMALRPGDKDYSPRERRGHRRRDPRSSHVLPRWGEAHFTSSQERKPMPQQEGCSGQAFWHREGSDDLRQRNRPHQNRLH